MEMDRAIEVVEKLADGIDPVSGEKHGEDSPYQQADTVRALHTLLGAVKGVGAEQVKKDGPPKAGKAWSEAEEKEMVEMFDANVKVVDIATTLERTKGAIWARLEKVGRVSRDENGKVVVKPAAAKGEPAQQAEPEPEPANFEF